MKLYECVDCSMRVIPSAVLARLHAMIWRHHRCHEMGDGERAALLGALVDAPEPTRGASHE
jgi:hypothetical protein